MEEKAPEQTQVQAPVVESKPKKDPFSLFGKIALVGIVAAVLIGGGMYAGVQFSKQKSGMPVPTPQAPTPSQTVIATPTIQPATSPTLSAMQTVTAGGKSSAPMFGAYTLTVLSGWTTTPETGSGIDKLTISKDSYSITINQGAFGGGGCIYPGDPAAEMAQSFTKFTDITAGSVKLRRSWNTTGNPANTIVYTICQQSGASYGAVTSFGRIDVKSPDPADPSLLTQIDSILSSITKK